jgi:hypothetical protein
MWLPIERDLPPEERDRLLERAATAVVRRRLEMPAVLLLELHRPLTYLSSQALVLFTPLLGAALGLERVQTLAKLLEERENLDRLIDRIETLSRETPPPAPSPRRRGGLEQPGPDPPLRFGKGAGGGVSMETTEKAPNDLP